jgi:CO dehydrogenase maturation factor
MRIAFLGKGGSGKTTTAGAFARWVALNKGSVLAIDADLNCHLGEVLGMDGTPADLGQSFEEIAQYVRGQREDLGDKPIISTTPPSPKSTLIRPRPDDPLIARFCIKKNGITFLRVGGFASEDTGASCYHTKLSSLCVLLNHMADAKNEYVVVDATAGIDTVATPLSVAYDLMVFVVEPTKKSIQVVLDYLEIDPLSREKMVVVPNKVVDPKDLEYIAGQLGFLKLTGAITQSAALRDFEQDGDQRHFLSFVNENVDVWRTIDDSLHGIERDWIGMQSRLRVVHGKNCQTWYNSYYGVPLDVGLDQAFTPSLT